MKRIFVKENESGYTRYYYANWPITDGGGMEIIYAGGPTHDRVVEHHGEKGAELYMKVYDMATNFGFALISGHLRVTRSPAVKWHEIEPKILDAIREVYGPFEIERQPWITRISLAFHRLTATK